MNSNVTSLDDKNITDLHGWEECNKSENRIEKSDQSIVKLNQSPNQLSFEEQKNESMEHNSNEGIEKHKNELVEDITNHENNDQKTSSRSKQEENSSEGSADEEGHPLVEHLDHAPLYRDPTFAELCSFFNMFTPLFGFKPISFARLEKMLCTLVEGDATRELIDLHVMLMRKIYMKSARADKWEQSLQKFCSIAPGLDAEFRQLQRNTYGSIPIGSKLAVLKALCDCQFDYNLKFKENIANTFRHNELRLAPIGTDKRGQLYYFQIDCDLDFRVYSEETDDMAGVSWLLRSRTEAELAQLIETLQNPDYGVVTKEEQEVEEADLDEEQLLDQPREGEKDATNTRPSSTVSASKPFQPFLSEEERTKVKLEGKFSVLWDHYKKPELLNKRKNDKEKISQNVGTSSITIQSVSQEVNGSENVAEEQRPEVNEDEANGEETTKEKSQNAGQTAQAEKETHSDMDKLQELNEALLAEIEADEQRRIMPRRSARNAALHNIKAFGGSPRRQFASESAETTGASSFICPKKLGFVPATAGSCTDEDTEEDSEEEEAESGDDSSDDDFLLEGDEKPKRKAGRPPTKRMKGGRTKAKKRTPGKGAKKSGARRLRLIGHPPMTSSRKHQSIAIFEEGESSEDGDETTEVKERRERKKATEQTLCQICKGSKSPDLLLLCDSCDTAWHTFCLRPQLWFVPDGDWFCPFCEHGTLIRRLIYALILLREERKASENQRKKKEAADRLKKEMDYIGISLNNIIPFALQRDGIGQSGQWSAEDSAEEGSGGGANGGEGERKSKKKAMKMVMSKTREKQRIEKLYGPIVTIAEGRSRRALNKVDYNFHAYDEQLQEAMDSRANVQNDDEPSAGRGKDMQNIFEAERKQQQKEEPQKEGEREEGAPARPPKSGDGGRMAKKGGRKGKRLTDLNIGNATDSDTDEWKASSADEIEEDPEPSEDEYLPSERRSARGIGFQGRRRSDDEFINDDSDIDYLPSGKKKGVLGKRSVGRAKKRKKQMSSSSDEDNELEFSDSDSEPPGPSSRKRANPSKGQAPNRKWAPKASSPEEDDNVSVDEKEEIERTETGRPLRRAAENMRKKLKEELQYEEEEEGAEEEESDKVVETQEGRLADRAVSALARPQRAAATRSEEGDAEEFKPDEDDEAEADKEEEDAEKEEGLLVESDEDDDEAEESSQSTSTDKDEEEDNERKHSDSFKGRPSSDKSPKAKQNADKKAASPKRKAHSKKQKIAQKKGLTQTKPKTEKVVRNSSDNKEILADNNSPQQSMQRQTRQQLKKQQSLIQENALPEDSSSLDDLPTTSTNCDVQMEDNKTSESKLQNNSKEKAFSMAPMEVRVPSTSSFNDGNETAANKAAIVDTTVPVKAVTTASPHIARTATVFQQIHPQQLSQFFMRQNVPRQQQQHLQMPSNPLQAAIGNRFEAEPQPPHPSVSYAAYNMADQPLRIGSVPLPPGILNSHQCTGGGAIPFTAAHPQQTTYFVQPSGVPQIIYQTLQPISSVSSQQSTAQHQQTDPDGSLSHALAGAMNPEDL